MKFVLVQGPSLFTEMLSREFKPLSVKATKNLMRKLATIVKEFHQAGIVHLDLKLEHLKLVGKKSFGKLDLEKCNVAVIDFGLCDFITSINERESEVYCGSMDYVAPGKKLK